MSQHLLSTNPISAIDMLCGRGQGVYQRISPLSSFHPALQNENNDADFYLPH